MLQRRDYAYYYGVHFTCHTRSILTTLHRFDYNNIRGKKRESTEQELTTLHIRTHHLSPLGRIFINTDSLTVPLAFPIAVAADSNFAN